MEARWRGIEAASALQFFKRLAEAIPGLFGAPMRLLWRGDLASRRHSKDSLIKKNPGTQARAEALH